MSEVIRSLENLRNNCYRKSIVHETQAYLQEKGAQKYYILYALLAMAGTVITIMRSKLELFEGSDVLGEMLINGAAMIPMISKQTGDSIQAKQHSDLSQQFLCIANKATTATSNNVRDDIDLALLTSEYRALVSRSVFSPVFPEALEAGNRFLEKQNFLAECYRKIEIENNPYRTICEESLKRSWGHRRESEDLLKKWRKLQTAYILEVILVVTFPIVMVTWKDSTTVFVLYSLIVASGIGTQVLHMVSNARFEAIEHSRLSQEFFDLFECTQWPSPITPLTQASAKFFSLLQLETKGLSLQNLSDKWERTLASKGIISEPLGRLSSQAPGPAVDGVDVESMGGMIGVRVQP